MSNTDTVATVVTPATFADLTAALRDAIASADVQAIEVAMAAVEGYTAPVAASKRTATDVKRQVSQAIVDCLSTNLDALVAGPKDEPYTDAEQVIAKDKVANICGYLPNAAKLTWPENFAPRSGRGLGKTAAEGTAPEGKTDDSE